MHLASNSTWNKLRMGHNCHALLMGLSPYSYTESGLEFGPLELIPVQCNLLRSVIPVMDGRMPTAVTADRWSLG